MSRSQAIRDYLIANPGPKLAREIAAGIGADPTKTSHTIGVMFRDHWLDRTGTGQKMRYFLIRTESRLRPKMSRDEYLAKRREQERLREQAKGRMSLDQYQAWLVERRAQKSQQSEAAKAEAARLRRMAADIRRTRKAAEKAAAKVAQENAAREKRDAARQIVAMRLDAIATAPASQPEAETVAEYLARGGVIERLPPGVWSTPLRVEL